MSRIPLKCLVDTNVPITANLSLIPAKIPKELITCVSECVNAINHVIKKRGLVIDSGDEIFDEYRQHLKMSGQPGMGDHFVKWVHDNRWKFPDEDRVSITKNGETYAEFPDHPGLAGFDRSDRKFIAVSNAHPHKPPILQATDSKWWGWKDSLAEIGITVHFLSPEYIKAKYTEKMCR